MPSLTITLTTEQANRVSVAYQDKLRLSAPATISDVKVALIDEIRSVVRAYESKVAHQAVVVPADIEPT
jgi:hypothetical protein